MSVFVVPHISRLSAGTTFTPDTGVIVDRAEDGAPLTRAISFEYWQDVVAVFDGLTVEQKNELLAFFWVRRGQLVQFTLHGTTYQGRFSGTPAQVSYQGSDACTVQLDMRVREVVA